MHSCSFASVIVSETEQSLRIKQIKINKVRRRLLSFFQMSDVEILPILSFFRAAGPHPSRNVQL
jgi:hypothetical protein